MNSFHGVLRGCYRFMVLPLLVAAALQFGLPTVARAHSTLEYRVELLKLKAEAEAGLQLAAKTRTEIEKSANTAAVKKELLDLVAKAESKLKTSLATFVQQLKDAQEEQDGMAPPKRTFIVQGQPSLGSDLLVAFIAPGAHATLTFQFLDIASHLVVSGPSVASVLYETFPDTNDPATRVSLGTSTDAANGFPLDFVLNDLIELVMATPFDASGAPIFLRGIDDTDNIAQGIVVAIDSSNVVPTPASVPLVWTALALLALSPTRCGKRDLRPMPSS